MDSFYDQPRLLPPSRRNYEDVPCKILPTTVPDASMLFQNAGNILPKKAEMSYNAWKMQRNSKQPGSLQVNKENSFFKPPQTSICKKQVRFESPQVNKQLGTIKEVDTNFVNNKFNRCYQESYNKKDVPKQVETKLLQNKPFDKIYLANLPTTSLDLSIIEPKIQKTKNFKEDFSKNSREYFSSKPLEENNYQIGNREIPDDSFKIPPITHPQIPEAKITATKSTDDPSVKDLLKIIQQQNEQLINLQKQVNTLMEDRLVMQKQIENPPMVFKNSDKTLPKFSIDLMTSFEVSFRPQNEKKPNFNQAKITEIIEKDKDVSMVFNEPVFVRESCQSPEHSIHVDMQDFSSDEEDDSNHSSLIGWTIYNNVMDQVNHLLKKPEENRDFKEKVCFNTLRQVKETTLKHLKNVGIALPLHDAELLDSANLDIQADASQISFVVKQLLMKYLPDDKLSKITSNENKLKIPENYPKNAIKRRPDFSMATLQYMEKYNLLKKDTNVCNSQPKNDKNCQLKMLDITALKQQPKLL